MKPEDVKVGQKVSYAVSYANVEKSQIGTVRGTDERGWVGIQISNFAGGNDLRLFSGDALLPEGSTDGWWASPSLLSLAEEIPLNGNLLPTDAKERKRIPITSGVLDYFPAALAEIAKVSQAGNDQHNPGEKLHWAREKSTDHADCVARHLLEHGTFDSDGQRHTAKMAWRALAILQLELEAEGAPVARGAK